MIHRFKAQQEMSYITYCPNWRTDRRIMACNAIGEEVEKVVHDTGLRKPKSEAFAWLRLFPRHAEPDPEHLEDQVRYFERYRGILLF